MGIEKIKINTKKPVEMEVEMKLRELSILAGENNTGKTFMNIIIWYLYTLFATIKILRLQNPNIDNLLQEIEERARTIAKYTFVSDLDIDIIFVDNQGEQYTLSIFREDGDFDIEFGLDKQWYDVFYATDNNPLEYASVPIYLTSRVRNFKTIESYIKTKELLQLDPSAAEMIIKLSDPSEAEEIEQKFERLCEIFPLYELLTMENIVDAIEEYNALQSNSTFQIMKNTMLSYIKGDTSEFSMMFPDRFHIENGEIYGEYGREKVRLLQIGEGAQSMMITILLQLTTAV